MALTKSDLKAIEAIVSTAISSAFSVHNKHLALYFDRIDKRFEQIEKRLDEHDKKFEQIEKRFEHIELRFEQIDQRFESIEQRFDRKLRQQTDEIVEVFREYMGAADALYATNERVDTIESRVKVLEN